MALGTLCAYTIDDGSSWRWSRFPQGFLMFAVQFVDRYHGFAVGEEGTIYTSIDGGMTWDFQRRVVGAGLSSIAMADHMHGWVAGYDGAIMYTKTGGLPPSPR